MKRMERIVLAAAVLMFPSARGLAMKGETLSDENYGRFFVSCDSWSQHDIQIGVFPAPADSDDDGVGNLEEFRAGTLAGSSDSMFKISQIADEAMVSVTWLGAPGRTYTLHAAPTVPGSWFPLPDASGIEATDATTTVQKARPEDGSDLFLRIGVE